MDNKQHRMQRTCATAAFILAYAFVVWSISFPSSERRLKPAEHEIATFIPRQMN